MRLLTLLVTAIFIASPALAQQVQPSSSAAGLSASRDTSQMNLPVSLDKIREALAEAPAEPLKGLDVKPHFRVQIQERQKFEALLETLKFDSGPAVPGGLYGYDQQQRLFPKVDNPLVQPYAAFSQGELLQVMITTLVEKYLAGRLVSAVTSAERARAEEEARKEVARALDEFWAARAQQLDTPDKR
jgi:hypothetical protein